MSDRVLLVCAMNRCRSPIMAARLSRVGEAERIAWLVDSAGTRAVEGQTLCRAAAPLVGRGESDQHAARRLLATDLDLADLVLAASTRERGEIAKLRPPARSKTFTLREAALLAGPAVSPGELARLELDGTDVSPLTTFAALLHARRGLVPGSFVKRGGSTSNLDLRDSHGQRRHARDLNRAAAAAADFGEILARFVHLHSGP